MIGTKNDKDNKTASIETMKKLFRNEPIQEFFEVSSTDIADKSFERCLENIMKAMLLKNDGVVQQMKPISANKPKKEPKCC